MWSKLRQLWRRLPWWERVVWGLVVLCLVGAVGIKPLVRWCADPQLQVDLAFEGFRRFGKGRHRAGLNFGDLFAYGLAAALGEPLLFKGDDFGHTDSSVA